MMPLTRSNSRPKANLEVSLKPTRAWSFEAIGTVWSIELYDVLPELDLPELKEQVAERIAAFDANYSRFRDDSQVARWASQAGTYQLPPDAGPMFELYRRLYDATNGKMTPLVGQLLSDAGYDSTYSLQARLELTSSPSWDDAIEYLPAQADGAATLIMKQPALLDFGAAGKGYLVDIICDMLLAHGVESLCVDAGGDMRYQAALGKDAAEPFVVGLEHPDNPELAAGVAELGAARPAASWTAICGSAGNRRAWGKYHHIMDPASRESPRHIKAVWVAANSAILADGLATALYFVPPETLLQHFTFAYAIIHTDGSANLSSNFPGRFFVE